MKPRDRTGRGQERPSAAQEAKAILTLKLGSLHVSTARRPAGHRDAHPSCYSTQDLRVMTENTDEFQEIAFYVHTRREAGGLTDLYSNNTVGCKTSAW